MLNEPEALAFAIGVLAGKRDAAPTPTTAAIYQAIEGLLPRASELGLDLDDAVVRYP